MGLHNLRGRNAYKLGKKDTNTPRFSEIVKDTLMFSIIVTQTSFGANKLLFWINLGSFIRVCDYF